MRAVLMAASLVASSLVSAAGLQSAPKAPVACDLLTTAQVQGALGGTVAAGKPIFTATSCQWAGQQGKRLTLTINQPRGTQSPVDQFNTAKTRTMPGITIEPVSGAGDDAYYVYFAGQDRAGCGLVIKKGSSVFELRIYGFDLAEAKKLMKPLGQDAAAKI